jgi:endonuclease YncB( thermonuclease family)
LKTTLSLAAITLLGANAFAHPGGVDEDGCHVETKTQQPHCHNKALFDSSRPARPGDEGAFFGPLVSVTDGDTLQVKVQGVVMDFRLAGIDAPESDQPYGAKAKQELVSLIGKNPCVVVPIDTDRYGRTIAFLWVGDAYVNRELVKRGAAWFYSEFASDASLFSVEENARAQQRGLWSLPLKDRVEPWLWRRERRGQVMAPTEHSPSSQRRGLMP